MYVRRVEERRYKVVYYRYSMDDRRKTVAALTIIVGVIVFIVVIIGIVVSGRKVISPVPDEGAIRVIFISPTP